MHSYYFIATTDKRPELYHLIELLAPISSKWGLIGDELGVHIEIIDDFNKSDDMMIDEVIKKWIETKPSPTTWDNIIKVVRGPVIQSLCVANNIQEYLDQMLSDQEQAKIQSM